MTEIFKVNADGRFRVRLEADSDAANPRRADYHLTHAITPRGQHCIDVDPDGGPLQYGWDRFGERGNAVELFKRWARIFHNAVVVESRPHQGARALWYMTRRDAMKLGMPPTDILAAEIAEYQAWANGDVWVLTVEEATTWQRMGTSTDETMQTWIEVESIGGLIGRDYAEQCATEMLEYNEMAAK